MERRVPSEQREITGGRRDPSWGAEPIKVFALIRYADGAGGRIVGYGMVLPDGSAYSVSWPTGCGTSFHSASSAEATAALRGADVLWMSACVVPERHAVSTADGTGLSFGDRPIPPLKGKP